MSEIEAQVASISLNEAKPKKAAKAAKGGEAVTATPCLKPREKIVITLPNGSEREGTSWETTPMDIAKSISMSLAKAL
ncbi:threonyl-tRNA synthetase, partial [Coemansia sp. RSA 25]